MRRREALRIIGATAGGLALASLLPARADAGATEASYGIWCRPTLDELNVTGVRTTFTVVREGGFSGGFWTSISIGTYWGQVGVQYRSGTPNLVQMFFGNPPNTFNTSPIAAWPLNAQAHNMAIGSVHTTSIERSDVNTWDVVLDGSPFVRYLLDADSSRSGYIALAGEENNKTTGIKPFTFAPAIEYRIGADPWKAAEHATIAGAPTVKWGMAGALQDPTLAPNVVVVGGRSGVSSGDLF